jgi:hypothetical protein
MDNHGSGHGTGDNGEYEDGDPCRCRNKDGRRPTPHTDRMIMVMAAVIALTAAVLMVRWWGGWQ